MTDELLDEATYDDLRPRQWLAGVVHRIRRVRRHLAGQPGAATYTTLGCLFGGVVQHPVTVV